ncbi:ATP-dependent DNA helicase [Arsenicicoccus sp. oral taxon 190]|uniref:ATP-dependent DNA helicase n=1 Tax=Arsenicicoccus sp. oral taxon 190 TaxID=1658671 RepID=UPI000679ED7B|nr:ATP-dependent DNA helicase [Arsenicicoccus sp. oral taxon 190]AKT51396.1 hypothetical protein ADJ73_08810 [Arsenicicoccus sp. oral taxon 190]
MTARHSALDIARALGQPAPTPEQQAVIESPLESLLVVAGAGSGKTETMSARVVWLVANDLVAPAEILGLTFTRKAAGELADRIGRRLRQLVAAGLWQPADGGEVELAPTVSTYHAYAGRLVSEHGLRLGVEPGARLLSQASCWQLAHEIVQGYQGPLDEAARRAGRPVPAVSTVVDAVLALSGQLAEHLRTPQDLQRHLDLVVDAWDALPPGSRRRADLAEVADALGVLRTRRAVVPLLEAYAAAKREAEAVDFADQMSLAARIASTFPDVGRAERSRYRAVLLDEFQDTSEAQLVLLRELYAAAQADVPVMAVGDPHQSIYGWRGASSTTLTSFPRHFPTAAGPARTLPLSTSWRNDESILAAANVVAGPLTQACAVDVAVLRARPDAATGAVTAARLPTSQEEAHLVAAWIHDRLVPSPPRGASSPGDLGRPPSAAVLCRKRSQFPAIVEALEQQGLAVEVVGVGGLLTMPEVTDLVSFLHVVDDPARGDHLVRLLTGPLVHLGAADLAALHDWARALGHDLDQDEAMVGLVEALDRLPPEGWVSGRGRSLSGQARLRLRDLRGRVRRVRELLSATLSEVVGEAERALGLDLELMARPGRPAAEARVHLEAFADVVADYATGSDRPTLAGLLAWLAAAEAEERGLAPGAVTPAPGAVQVLTVHAAKGLEWDLVAVPGLEEGTFPSHEARVVTDSQGGWRMPPPKDKTWLIGLDTVPFGLRGDRSGLPALTWQSSPDQAELSKRISDFVLACGEHGVMEERRLAYVAVTRARHELLLTASVWGQQRKPRVTSRFLEELRDAGACTTVGWAPMPDSDPAPTNPMLEQAVQVSWPAAVAPAAALHRAADAVRAAQAALAEAPDLAAPRPVATTQPPPDSAWAELDAEIGVLLAERDRATRPRPGTASPLPGHLSTSALVSLADDPEVFRAELRRPMPAPPATAARRGTSFHAWVEQHYGQAAIVDLDELPGSADEGTLADHDVATMKEHFLASEWAGRTPSDIELAVESTIAGLSVRGRIDAVFPRPEGGCTVVDWKTGARPHGRRARVRELQLAVYRLAYARLRGLPLDQVDAAFYYAASGETVRPQLLDEPELERAVAALLDEG